MKSILSLLTVCSFFMVQSLSTSVLAKEKADIREEAVKHILDLGATFQHVAEVDGEEAADRVFRDYFKDFHARLTQKISLWIKQASTEELNQVLLQLKQNQNEETQTVLRNRSLSDQEKVETLLIVQSQDQLDQQISIVQGRARSVGYEGAFLELSTELRSRTFSIDWDGLCDDWEELDFFYFGVAITAMAAFWVDPSKIGWLLASGLFFILMGENLESHRGW